MPSGVSSSATSRKPSARSASATQFAAAWLSLCGNWAQSATDWKATSSVSSALARGMSEATVSAIGFWDMGTLLVGATLLWVPGYGECKAKGCHDPRTEGRGGGSP
ncbi:predicted protein [Streptomyces sp. C]|nr:predicted protein [Streptomyces sp. C]